MSYQVKVIKDNIGFENALEEVYKALGEAGLDGRRTDPLQ